MKTLSTVRTMGLRSNIPEMDQRFPRNLPYLPAEIIINILSRLPIRTIISCKRVCKSWFELVKTPEFADFHLSVSVPGLIVHHSELYSNTFKIFEFEDKLELEQYQLHDVPVAKFQRTAFISHHDYAYIYLEGSANGLLFLVDFRPEIKSLYICNPITREYINLSNPEEIFPCPSVVTYGFGVSKKTDQYKVVIISHDCIRDLDTGSSMSILNFECRVYTLGTGSWRSIQPDSSHEYNCHSNGVFLNGNLNWLVSELEGPRLISCFDLETELFKVFSLPPPLQECGTLVSDVGVLGDQLCICDNTSRSEVVIWVMKEYGVEKSWTKEIVMCKLYGWLSNLVYPIKVFRDGDILLIWGEYNNNLVYYSNKTKTASIVDSPELIRSARMEARLHVSGFLSLKRFAMENVAKF